MIRTQIQLSEEQVARIREVAASHEVSMAAVIREAIAQYLASSPDAREDRYSRAKDAAGRFASGRRDLSKRHDAHFAEATRK